MSDSVVRWCCRAVNGMDGIAPGHHAKVERRVESLVRTAVLSEQVRLVVALETVKKHLGHIFDKLGAANRSEAVARAREPHLIS